MSTTLLGLLLIVLINLAAFVLWKLSRWIAVRVTSSGTGDSAAFDSTARDSTALGRLRADPSVAGQLRPDATVPVARLRRGRRAPYPRGDREISERIIAEDLRAPGSQHRELPPLSTVGAVPPAARLDVGILLVR